MQLAPFGRIIFVAQWVLALFLPVFVVLGRGLIGAELGWMSVLGVLYGPVLIVLLVVPPILALFDPVARRARSTRQAYAVASAVLWLTLIVMGLTIPDASEQSTLDSALTSWFGLSYETSVIVFSIAMAIGIVAWLTALGTAIAGIVAGRRAPSPA